VRNLLNFALFQAAWFVAVSGVARGAGAVVTPLATVGALVVLHLAFVVRPGARRRELRLLACVGLAGTVADSLLLAAGATAYPNVPEGWPGALVPPLISGMWIAFATLLRHSLGWLAGRPLLATVLGAVGGPLSYLAGTRLGAVAVGDQPALTWGLLGAEYAIATPLLPALAHRAPSRGAGAVPATPRSTA
jgi:hypothetical protein